MSSDEFSRTGEPGVDAALWDEPEDLSEMKMFTQEIENVDASDWDVDSESLWGGEEPDLGVDVGDGLFDSDFPG
ncbi:hypothetical protein [Microbacterium profundi]